jgi:CrcB protein
MSGLPILAVFGGAGFGALLRWGLGLWLNPVYPAIPLGTVASNLIGGLLIGAASVVFTHFPVVPAEWRLFVLTGFLGGLTTFSTFSIEVVTLIDRHQYGTACAAAGVHLLGSLLLTGAGIVLANAVLVRT